MVKKQSLDKWISNLRIGINGYDYYVDFNEVYNHVKNIRFYLDCMNSLINSKDIENDIRKLLIKYPPVLNCFPLLLAVRIKELKDLNESEKDAESTHKRKRKTQENKEYQDNFLYAESPIDPEHLEKEVEWVNLNFKHLDPAYTVEQYIYFMKKSKLLDLLSNHRISNLVDYVTGVEVGMNSNARKNRTGTIMENRVELYIKKTGFRYEHGKTIPKLEEAWNKDFHITNNELLRKKWDFLVETPKTLFLIEVNFYKTNGSKPTEIVRSYTHLSNLANQNKNVKFVWITDGKYGWNPSKKTLQDAYNQIEYLFNLNDLKLGALDNLFKEEQ